MKILKIEETKLKDLYLHLDDAERMFIRFQDGKKVFKIVKRVKEELNQIINTCDEEVIDDIKDLKNRQDTLAGRLKDLEKEIKHRI